MIADQLWITCRGTEWQNRIVWDLKIRIYLKIQKFKH
jgi:hypothetical protein